MRKKKTTEQLPLTELAKGFRKRTWVTTKLMAKLSKSMAKKNLRLDHVMGQVDEDDAVAAAEELLSQLDGLKGLAMKIGQMISYLDGALPPKAKNVLARLQFESQPMAIAEIAAVIERDLGAKPEALFDAFESLPFAAASIGQVHLAQTKGETVAVKVQYPQIEKLMARDIKLIRRLTRVAMSLTPMDGGGLLDELQQRLLEECDYNAEATNQTYFHNLLRDDPDVSVPRVYPELSGRRVLTSGYVSGLNFHQFIEQASQEAKNRAGATIYRTCFDGIFRHCMYNADPHPGNYLFSEEGQVTLLDFGCVKRFERELIDGWKRLAIAILANDLKAFEHEWLAAGFVGRRWRFDYAHQLEAMRELYEPMLSETPYRFTPEFITRANDRMSLHNKNKFKMSMTPDWLFIGRLQFGLFSVLSLLGSEVRWGDYYRAAVNANTEPLYERNPKDPVAASPVLPLGSLD